VKGRIDNLRSASLGHRLRGVGMFALGVAVFGGLLGVPMRRLALTEAKHSGQIDAGRRLEDLREEQELFAGAGGPVALQALANGIVGDLPADLSRTDLHGVVTLLAKVCGLELKSLSVGEFRLIDAEHLDDAVAMSELKLGADGNLESLQNLVSLLRQLGYPAVIEDFRLSREDLNAITFNVHATLGLFQSIPIPETPSAGDVDEDFPQ